MTSKFKLLLLKMVESDWEAVAISKADATLTHVARVKIRVWLMVDCLIWKEKDNTPLYCYFIMYSLIN